MVLGLAAGVFYREFTKFNNYTGETSLASVHPHYIALGVFFMLIVGLIVKEYKLIKKEKSFTRFMSCFHIALNGTTIMMLIRGITQVLGTALSKGANAAISGVAGVFHILLALSFFFFFRALLKVIHD